jgi:ankyrin repeat protein
MSTRTNNGGETPALAAARIKNEKVIGALIAASADVNKASKYGTTPVLAAAGNENEKVIDALIAAGADVNKTDNRRLDARVWRRLASRTRR